MIKNLLKRIRKFFGLLDLKGENNPYPLNSSPEIHVNTFSAYPDTHGNFENDKNCNFCGKSIKEQMNGCKEISCYRQFKNNDNKTHYFHEDNRVFDGSGIISQIDSSWPNNDSNNDSSNDSSGSYDTDSSSNSNDSSDW